MRTLRVIFVPLVGGALLFAVACGGSSAHQNQNIVTSSGSNVQPMAVNSGPAGSYANGGFTSVTLCTPGTSTCQTIDGVLVDTGSSGLRILSSTLTIGLTQENASDGNPLAECLPFVSGFTWGAVKTADVKMASETASAAPVQIIGGSTFPVPTACSDNGPPENTLSDLGANGILGVGVFPQDCGNACVTTGPQNPELYYECPSGGCSLVGVPLTQQVVNPVAMFATDNNGVIIELPSVSSPQVSISGSLVFGIGTQSNNGLGGATVYAVDGFGNFITSYKNVTYSQSFLDSGSNGYFFLTSGITGMAECGDAQGFYCPSSTQNFSATTSGTGQGQNTNVTFSVANADNLFNDNPDAFVFETLGGSNSLQGFDWGLPFFYGRNVYTAIAGKSTPGGVGPFWAY